MKKYYGDETRWFLGTVVNVNDPLELGRVLVRIYGIHSDNELEVPDADLPWAQVIMPITEGGVSNLGGLLGIKRNAQVFGVFLDGKDSQMPVVLGSLPKLEDYSQGGQTTSVLARGLLAEEHISRINKENMRYDLDGNQITYSTATAAKLSTINEKADAYYADDDWAEPEVSGGTFPRYPFNLVKETASGHVEEFDDTPGSRRYHRYHPSGTFEEIVDDGTRTIKVVGKDYEMYLNGKNVYVNGNLNLTVSGDKRELIQGNYHLEVEGDMTMNLHQSLQTKVEMNHETEIGGYRVANVKSDDNLTILSGDQNLNIMGIIDATNPPTSLPGNRNVDIKLSDRKTVGLNVSSLNLGTNTTTCVGNYSVVSSAGLLTMTAAGIISIESTTAMSLDGGLLMTSTATAVSETYTTGTINVTGGNVIASTVSLASHVHTGVTGGPSNTGGPI